MLVCIYACMDNCVDAFSNAFLWECNFACIFACIFENECKNAGKNTFCTCRHAKMHAKLHAKMHTRMCTSACKLVYMNQANVYVIWTTSNKHHLAVIFCFAPSTGYDWILLAWACRSTWLLPGTWLAALLVICVALLDLTWTCNEERAVFSSSMTFLSLGLSSSKVGHLDRLLMLSQLFNPPLEWLDSRAVILTYKNSWE